MGINKLSINVMFHLSNAEHQFLYSSHLVQNQFSSKNKAMLFQKCICSEKSNLPNFTTSVHFFITECTHFTCLYMAWCNVIVHGLVLVVPMTQWFPEGKKRTWHIENTSRRIHLWLDKQIVIASRFYIFCVWPWDESVSEANNLSGFCAWIGRNISICGSHLDWCLCIYQCCVSWCWLPLLLLWDCVNLRVI